jgi:hypothetical protein
MANIAQNQRWNAVRQAGNTVEWFQKFKEIIPCNDGKREAGMTVAYCHDQQAAFNFMEHTQIEIMSPTFDVSNIRKGFITARCEFQVQIVGLIANNAGTAFTDADHLGKLFIGYKAASQAVRRMQIYHKGRATSYLNEYIVQEGVAFANTRPFTAKDKKRFIYSLYENASRYMPDICGTYISLADFIDGAAHPVEIEFNIPVVDFLALQCFEKWLKEFGKITLEIYLSHASLVVCTCNPKDVLENKLYLQTDNIQYPVIQAGVGSNIYGFEHRFTQVGDQFTGFTFVANGGVSGPNGTTTITTGFLRVIRPES